MKNLLFAAIASMTIGISSYAQSWTADNGNGTFTNPLFYDEFSDPDIIRVGDDYYLAGTTMHCLPGLVVLHSRDLVNWEFLSYCMDRFDMGDGFRLENGKNAYGQGIWAPCIRYNDGKFYIFSNINGQGLQIFISENPAGPWQHINTRIPIHDLSVLFDNGKAYAIYNYGEVRAVEFKPDFSGFVDGSERVLIPTGNAMGEGHHAYKIDGKYYILSADYAPMGRMQCARADNFFGPYETTVISAKETMGVQPARFTTNVGQRGLVPDDGYEYTLSSNDATNIGCASMHQGGIVQLPNGDWWGISMQDFRTVGRTVCLSPITWTDGWPYFGLPQNLGRTPKTWTKPATGHSQAPSAPYLRSDNFNSGKLLPVWQWNHEPADKEWRLTKNGRLRLNALPAKNMLWARNTLTQRCIGPVSTTTVTIDPAKMKSGDVAGLGILNMPYSRLSVVADGNTAPTLQWYDQYGDRSQSLRLDSRNQLRLRVETDLEQNWALYSYSSAGSEFKVIGDTVPLAYQLKTFQGPRIALHAFNTAGTKGGYAEFDDFTVSEPMADRSANLPLNKTINLTNLGSGAPVAALPHGLLHPGTDINSADCRFQVLDRGNGMVVLKAVNGSGYLTITGKGLSGDVRLMPEESPASLIMWQDMLRGQCMLLSMKTERFIGMDPRSGESYSADWAGCNPDRRDGTVFAWQICE